MNISEKIARIRLEPEHIRLRWVWGSVAISMFIIFIIWIFSIGSLFQRGNDAPSAESASGDITQQLQNLKQQAPSIKDFKEPSLGGEGVVRTKDSADFQYPTTTTTPIESDYSDQAAASVQ